MNKNDIFLSAACDAEYVAFHKCEAIANGYGMPPEEHCGYTLIANRLVPETFIYRVNQELKDLHFEYGYVLSEEGIFDDEFLQTLDSEERSVLMSVVMLLVARGDFQVNLWASKGLGHDDCESEI